MMNTLLPYKKIMKTVLFSIFVLGLFFVFSGNVLAQDTFGVEVVQETTKLGGEDIRVTVAKIINVFLMLLGTIAVGLVLYGGFVYMTSGGSEEKIAQAKKILINATIGLVIIMSAFAITQFVLNKLEQATIQGPAGEDGVHQNAGKCQDVGNCPVPIGAGGAPDVQCLQKNKFFVVLSISPNTAVVDGDTGMTNVTVRAVFNQPIHIDTEEETLFHVRLAGEDVDIEEAAVHIIESRFVAEAEFSVPTDKCVRAEGVQDSCLAVAEYLIEVDAKVTNKAGRVLDVETPCGEYPREAAFVNNIDELDVDAPTVDVISVDGQTEEVVGDDAIILRRGFVYAIESTLQDRAADRGGLSYFGLHVERVRPGGKGLLDVFNYIDGPRVADGSHGPHDFLYRLPLGERLEVPAKYGVTLRAHDIDGNVGEQKTDFVVVGENCLNNRRDPGESGIDIGGDCRGMGQCIENWQCASNKCGDDGQCVEWPEIQDIIPDTWDGAAGNFITIVGRFFGTQPGTVEFGFDRDGNGEIGNDFIEVINPEGLPEGALCHASEDCRENNCSAVAGEEKICCPANTCSLLPEDDFCVPEGHVFDDDMFGLGIGHKVCFGGNWVEDADKNGIPDNPQNEWVVAAAPQACAERNIPLWTDSWVVVEIPDDVQLPLASESIIRITKNVELPAGEPLFQDLSNDAHGLKPGPKLGLFTKNQIKRPGICSLENLQNNAITEGVAGDDIVVHGSGFGLIEQGKILFANVEADIDNWNEQRAQTKVPALEPTQLFVSVKSDNEQSNGIGFTVISEEDRDTQPFIDSIDPVATTPGSLVSLFGRNFGERGFVFLADTPEAAAACRPGGGCLEASIDLPGNCGVTWEDDTIIVQVPVGAEPVQIININGQPEGVLCHASDDCRENNCSALTGEQKMCCPANTCGLLPEDDFCVPEGHVFDDDFFGLNIGNKVCSSGNWVDDADKNGIPDNPQIGDSFIAVWSGDKSSDGNTSLQINSGKPQPGICRIEPSSGPAPRPEGEPISLTGINFSLTPTVYFSQRGYDPEDIATWLWSGRDQIDGNEVVLIKKIDGIQTLIPENDQGFSMNMGPGRIKVQASQGNLSNAVQYTVSDCRVDDAPPGDPADYRCCDEGTGAGLWVRNGQACPGETREAGYVWRFTTGKIPNVPQVLEQCDVGNWNDPDADVAVPSPAPWRQNPQGDQACLNASIVVKFSTSMNEETLGNDNVKLFLCEEDEDGEPNCAGDAREVVAEDQMDLAYEGGALFIKRGNLVANQWYHIELSDQIESQEMVRVAGINREQSYPLLVTRPCGTGTAYCFDFKTGNGTCQLTAADINPTTKTTDALGVLQDSRFASDELHPEAPLHPFYFYVWGRGSQVCQPLDVDGIGWEWESDDARVEPTVAVDENYIDSRATVRATANTAPDVARVSAVLDADNNFGPMDAGSNVMVDLGDPEIIRFWPSCAESCTNAVIGMEFSRMMNVNTYRAGFSVQKCEDEFCRRVVPGFVQLDDVEVDSKLRYRVRPVPALEEGAWYLAKATNHMLSIGSLDPLRDGPPLVEFSWKFRTKQVDGFCKIESVRLEPSPFTARFITEKTKYLSIPYSSPDACSSQGQELNPWGYGWEWGSQEDTVADVSDFVFYGVTKPYCSTSCLFKGSSISRDSYLSVPPVCGDGVVGPGEDCDIAVAGEVAGVSCSLQCLRPGNSTAGDDADLAQCGNGRVNAAAGEECDTAHVDHGAFCKENCTWMGSSSQPSQGEEEVAWCGSGGVPTDGEDCDIAITLEQAGQHPQYSQIGCSSQCLHLGTSLSSLWCDVHRNDSEETKLACERSLSICGNGQIELGEECEIRENKLFINGAVGEVAVPFDDTELYCSNTCLLQNLCEVPGIPMVDQGGVKCDPDEPYCSSECKILGSSVYYDDPSMCGDAVLEVGEYGACELTADEARLQGEVLGENPIQIVTAIGRGEVVKGKQQTTITAEAKKGPEQQDDGSIISTPINPPVSGVGDYTLQCGFTESEVVVETVVVEEPLLPQIEDEEDWGVAQDCENHRGGDGEYILCIGGTFRHDGGALFTFSVKDDDGIMMTVLGVGGVFIGNGETESVESNGKLYTITAVEFDVLTQKQKIKVMLITNEGGFGITENCVQDSDCFSNNCSSLVRGFGKCVPYNFCSLSPLNFWETNSRTIIFVPEGYIYDDEQEGPVLGIGNKVCIAEEWLDDADKDGVPDNIPEPEPIEPAQEEPEQVVISEVTTSNDCPQNADQSRGVGTNSCCYARPARTAEYPEHGSFDVCRNTVISVDFSGDSVIDPETLEGNILLAEGHEEVDFQCPLGQTNVTGVVRTVLAQAFPEESQGFFRRIWGKVKSFFAGVFGSSVHAAVPPVQHNNIQVWCAGGIGVEPTVSSSWNDEKTVVTSIVNIMVDRPLEQSAVYAVVFSGGLQGIRNDMGVSIRSANPENPNLESSADNIFVSTDYFTFKTGEDICKLKSVSVNPVQQLFTVPEQEVDFLAETQSLSGQQIQSIPRVYAWNWVWGPTNNDVFTVPENVEDVDITISSKNVEGQLPAIAQAIITADADGNGHVGKVFSGITQLTAKFCENPWPSRDTFPYVDADFNFGIEYCADAGVSGTTIDDLPFLEATFGDVNPVAVVQGRCSGTDDLCDENSDCGEGDQAICLGFCVDVDGGAVGFGCSSNLDCHAAGSTCDVPHPALEGQAGLVSEDTLKRTLFFNRVNDDVIGVQILQNTIPQRLTASAWFEDKFPFADVQPISIAGYDAVTDGSSYYINALNQEGQEADRKVFNNIYVFSINKNAQADTRNVFEQLLSSLKFNTNLTDYGRCLHESVEDEKIPVDAEKLRSLAVEGVACQTDFDCKQANGEPQTGTNGICSNAKTKFLRDWERLIDVRVAQSKIQAYHDDINNLGYKELEAGTYIPQYTNSHWPSWGLLGGLPIDPVNRWSQCEVCEPQEIEEDGQIVEREVCVQKDPQTCWDQQEATFYCPLAMSIVEYSAEGTSNYTLHVPMEYFEEDEEVIKEFVFTDHFTTERWCQPRAQHNPFSGRCGDGVVNAGGPDEPGEQCDPPGSSQSGQTQGIVEDVLANCPADSKATRSCTSACQWEYSECSAIDICGDGIIQGDETCDDGELNGRYGHCDAPGQVNEADLGCRSVGAAGFCGNGTQDAPHEFCENIQQSPEDAFQVVWSNLDDANEKARVYYGAGIEIAECLGRGIDALLCFSIIDPAYREQRHCRLDKSLLCRNDADCFAPARSAGIYDITDENTNIEFSNELVDFGNCVNMNNIGTTYNFFEELSCSLDCRSVGGFCGDGVAQAAEECDDGNDNEADGCTRFCKSIDFVPQGDIAPAGSCGDGEIQTPNTNGVRESCDAGDRNGVSCAPEYDKSCTYCADDCSEVLTVDAIAYCGNGIIDRVGEVEIEGGQIVSDYERCDVMAGTDTVIASSLYDDAIAVDMDIATKIRFLSQGLESIPPTQIREKICTSQGNERIAKGTVTCDNNCKVLNRTACVSCGTYDNAGKPIPKVAVFNVLTPLSSVDDEDKSWAKNTSRGLYMLNGQNPFLGKTNSWKTVFAGGVESNDRRYIKSVNYSDYTKPAWLLSSIDQFPLDRGYGWHDTDAAGENTGDYQELSKGIESNYLCSEEYSMYFNMKEIWDELPAPKSANDIAGLDFNGENIYHRYGDFFEYSVSDESRVIENSFVLSPAIPENHMRIVVRAKSIKDDDDVFGFVGNVFSKKYSDPLTDNNGTHGRLSYLDVFSFSDMVSGTCKNMTNEDSSNNLWDEYWKPTDCLEFSKTTMNRIGTVSGEMAQATTVYLDTDVTNNTNSPFAFFVSVITNNTNVPISSFRNREVQVEVYTYHEGQIPEYSVYKPTYVFNMNLADVSGNNALAKYWHVFNIVKIGQNYHIRTASKQHESVEMQDNIATDNGSIETGYVDVLCNVPGEICNREQL
jgi:cysteine-rich repeat protein